MGKGFFMLLLMLTVYPLLAQESYRIIRGKVTDGSNTLSNVNVSVKGSTAGTKTDKKGKYTIDVSPKDVLIFSHIGMKTVEFEVIPGLSNLNVALTPDVEQLDEVTVKKRRYKTRKELLAEYPSNKNLIKTSWGILDKERASYAMRMVDGSEILPMGPDFLNSLRAHFPNMLIDRVNCSPPCVYLEILGRDAPPAIFDVDGFIYEQAPTFIIPDEIDRIAVMKKNGAFARYGPAASGGVIIINTKEKTRIDELGVERVYDNSGLADSLVNELNRKVPFSSSVPDYIRDFHTKASEKDAFAHYEREKRNYDKSPQYFLDVAEYFRSKLGSEGKSQEVLDEFQTKFSADNEALKALAYRYEELGQTENALQVYLKILKLRSRAAQSHRDVANAYLAMGNYKKALQYYARYETAVTVLDTIPFTENGPDLLMTTEANNIIQLKASSLSLPEVDLNKREEYPNTRIVVEWSHQNAEFELQVVSPDNYFDSWRTPSSDTLERVKGYQSQQFFLDDDFKGEWKVNCTYFGNTQGSPTYLKATVFFDYGKPSQSSQHLFFKLADKNIGWHLFSVDTKLKSIAD